MTEEFHDRVRAGFLEIAKAEPDRCAVVSADEGMEAVAKGIRTAVGRL
jgi:dTMP kinase